MLFTLAFWKGAFERAVKAFAQTLLALVTAQQTGLMGMGNFDWPTLLSVSLLAALLSVLTSITNPDFVAGKDAVAAAKAKADIAAAQATAGAAVSPAVGTAENVQIQVTPLDHDVLQEPSEPTGDATLPPGFFSSRASRPGDLT